jgi:hypothetical protein
MEEKKPLVLELNGKARSGYTRRLDQDKITSKQAERQERPQNSFADLEEIGKTCEAKADSQTWARPNQ